MAPGQAFGFAGAAAVLMLVQVQALALDRRFGFAGAAAVLMLVHVQAAAVLVLVLVLGRRFVLPVLLRCWCWCFRFAGAGAALVQALALARRGVSFCGRCSRAGAGAVQG